MKETIHTEKAPQALGPYVQAVRSGGFIYCSGQLGLDPATGKLVEGVEAQARQSMANLSAVLEKAGSSLAQAVKTTIFLADMNDFAAVNAVYGAALGDSFPARSCVQVAKLPLGGLVEIECIAAIG
jgi:2-iminobutanoate/2-iminopropanoate deaminase